jgi:hypothetical protein
MQVRALVLAATLPTSCVTFGQDAPVVDQLKHMLDVLQRRMQLEIEGSAPFHLVASYLQRGKLFFLLHVDVLETATDFGELDQPPSDGDFKLAVSPSSGPLFGDRFMRGQMLKKPVFPDPHTTSASEVVVKAYVDTTGSVELTEVVSSTDPTLNASVQSAVKDSKFRVSYQGDRVMAATWILGCKFTPGGETVIQ